VTWHGLVQDSKLRACIHPCVALVFLPRGGDGIPAHRFIDRLRAAPEEPRWERRKGRRRIEGRSRRFDGAGIQGAGRVAAYRPKHDPISGPVTSHPN
jgi:hypothetical protein